MSHPKDVHLNCLGCGKEVTLPYIGSGMVSISNIDGWTAPPLLCPPCSKQGKQTGATNG